MTASRIIAHITGAILIAAFAVLVFSQVFGVRFFSVLSGSMEPEIPTGSLVVVAPERLAGEVQQGDIVSYVADENLTVVTHRVVQSDPFNHTVTTQGDANEAADPPVLQANIVGKVVFAIPDLGYPLAYFSTLPGKIIAMTAIVTLLLLSALVTLLTSKRAMKRLIIAFEDEEDLTPETFLQIAQEFQRRRSASENLTQKPSHG